MGKERTEIISIAPFGNAVSNYFYELARYFVQQKFKVIIIFSLPSESLIFKSA